MSFTVGSHGSLLSPNADPNNPSPAATFEMQLNAASLAAASGTGFQIANAAILEP
jgi:hypothetical protein